MDLDRLVFGDFSLRARAVTSVPSQFSSQYGSGALPPNMPYVPPHDSHAFPPPTVPATGTATGMDVDVLGELKKLQQSVHALSLGKEKGGRGAPPGACWLCGKMGHQKRDCPQRDKEKGGDGKKVQFGTSKN